MVQVCLATVVVEECIVWDSSSSLCLNSLVLSACFTLGTSTFGKEGDHG